jgi:cytochrome c biogenesis protein CcmG, thiol:disulfide interchange protein DsbE
MPDQQKFYRLSTRGVILVLGIFILFLMTACGNVQAETKENQIVSVQAVGNSKQLDIQKPKAIQQLSQTVNTAALPQPEASAETTDSSDGSGAPETAEVSQAPAPAVLAAPAAAANSDSTIASAPPASATSNQAPQANAQLEVKPEVGFSAPDFTLQTLDGQTIRLSDLRGHPVFITYWSTWCVPCKTELPILQKIRQELAQSNIQMLTINAIEQDQLEAVQGLVGEMGLTMPVLLDHQNQFQSAYNQLFFPTSYFIDANGVIRFIKLGDASETDLRTNIEKLLNNQL